MSLLLACLQVPVLVADAGQALPTKDGRPAVATVNGTHISLEEFVAQLSPPTETGRLLQGRATAAELEVLDRLVTVRLIVEEAATMGLADLPEVRKQVDVMSRTFLREVLMERVVKDIEPDPAAVENQFKALVKEYRTASLLFSDEDTAKKAREEIEKGAAFAVVAERAIADKRATSESDAEYHRLKDYLPEIAQALAPLSVGQSSDVIRIKSGFAVVSVVDVRYPESAEERAEARRMVLTNQQLKAVQALEESLRAEYVVVKADVLNSLDYEAKEPGIDALLKDARVVAEIKGANPVTVGDLTDYLRMQFYHGGDPARQGKRMNGQKEAGLEATLGRRLLNMEALRLGLDRTGAYVDRVNAYEDSLVFDSFVQKVVVPDSKLKEEEVRQYYDGHLKDYSSPELMRIRGLAFTQKGDAEDAVRKLREGADFGWLAASADGQASRDTPGLLTFDGRPVTTDSMPDALRLALADAKAGEFRLYPSPEGPSYALAVQDVIAPAARPYDEVKTEIAQRLHQQKVKKVLEEYAGKLRAQSQVEIYLKKAQ